MIDVKTIFLTASTFKAYTYYNCVEHPFTNIRNPNNFILSNNFNSLLCVLF